MCVYVWDDLALGLIPLMLDFVRTLPRHVKSFEKHWEKNEPASEAQGPDGNNMSRGV